MGRREACLIWSAVLAGRFRGFPFTRALLFQILRSTWSEVDPSRPFSLRSFNRWVAEWRRSRILVPVGKLRTSSGAGRPSDLLTFDISFYHDGQARLVRVVRHAAAQMRVEGDDASLLLNILTALESPGT